MYFLSTAAPGLYNYQQQEQLMEPKKKIPWTHALLAYMTGTIHPDADPSNIKQLKKLIKKPRQEIFKLVHHMRQKNNQPITAKDVEAFQEKLNNHNGI